MKSLSKCGAALDGDKYPLHEGKVKAFSFDLSSHHIVLGKLYCI